MIPHWPTTFDFEGNKVKIIYLEGENKPYYNATTVAQGFGVKGSTRAKQAEGVSLRRKVTPDSTTLLPNS